MLVHMQSSSSSCDGFSETLPMKDTVERRRRKLQDALGSLGEDSDAPPALRRLALAEAEDVIPHWGELRELGNRQEEEHSAQYEETSGVGVTTTAPPSPRDENARSCSSRPDGAAQVCRITSRENVEPNVVRHNDAAHGMNGHSFNRRSVESRGPPSKTALLSPVLRAFSSFASSLCSLGHGVAATRTRGAAFPGGGNTSYPEGRSSFSSSQADKFLPDAPCLERRDAMSLERQCSTAGSGACVVRASLHVSDAAEVHQGSSATSFSSPFGLLEPDLFAASYPRGRNPERPRRSTVKATSTVKKAHCKEPVHSRVKERVFPPYSQNEAAVSLGGVQAHQRVRTREGEGFFSPLTSRQESTDSLMHFSSTAQAPRHNFFWSPRVHKQTQLQCQHSRVYSFSYASSEKTPCSPTASGSVRPWTSESLEWIHQRLLLQQGNAGTMPVFLSGSAAGEAGEGGAVRLPARHNGRLEENSISSLILTCATSNVDTMRTCPDAPLDAFMGSSTYTANGVMTPMT
ncbi:uncharacterized protein Tco025E_07718 [Trypanosoma conorhini]|uniref:Uncharacterized protein n=1 Tax=Trypanosoma conorhini TaxID=83891 RepID=A0A3R7RKA2_9TRYP|nr:uncharacterized protein Tco025E_07718 [Trypanosoma conorhini]RNF05862.1 hypothetical protein Tco025E_07718 [Trypanosoma conorhini]